MATNCSLCPTKALQIQGQEKAPYERAFRTILGCVRVQQRLAWYSSWCAWEHSRPSYSCNCLKRSTVVESCPRSHCQRYTVRGSSCSHNWCTSKPLVRTVRWSTRRWNWNWLCHLAYLVSSPWDNHRCWPCTNWLENATTHMKLSLYAFAMHSSI